jgi:predicted nucleic acid-binding protein
VAISVDSNILIDIVIDDPEFCTSSTVALAHWSAITDIVLCPVVWAELAAVVPDRRTFDTILKSLRVSYSPFESDSAFLAGEFWRTYCSRSPKRSRVIADFLVGAHACVTV